MAVDTRPVALELGRWLARNSVGRRLRSMREFSEQELIIPDGPFEGRRFKADRQPYTGLWLDAVDSGQWRRIVTTGPTQSGKTLLAFILPTLYHLFEIGETVICGLPMMEMASDKWAEDLLPAIEASRYRDMLPTQGSSARGGTKAESIRFKNGATLKFMTGGGRDKKRAGFTARVLVITETDGLDETGGTSREANKIKQLEGRVRAWGSRARIYQECTVSTEDGHTWSQYKANTESKIVRPCPHCDAWVTPEREHLVGWREAESVVEARTGAAFACPSCGALWTDAERYAANLVSKLVHKGQEVTPEGQIVGNAPQTDTLGFRWTAADNHFVTAADVGADEWRAAHSGDEENAEKEMRQFVWCLPWIPDIEDLTRLDPHQIVKRACLTPRSIVPDAVDFITATLDVGKRLCHWSTFGWKNDASAHVIDYGVIESKADELGEERALQLALREFRDLCERGWKDDSGELTRPSVVLIDSGYATDVVYKFVNEAESFVKREAQTFLGRVYWAAKGLGTNPELDGGYTHPKSVGAKVKKVWDQFYMAMVNGQFLIEMDSDYWKLWLHSRLSTPLDKPGTITLFQGRTETHWTWAKHVTAERQVKEFVPGKGNVTKWERISRNNHFGDSGYMNCVAGYMCGARLIDAVKKPQPKQQKRAAVTMPDGRPYFVMERG